MGRPAIRSPEPAMITAHTDVVGSLLRPVALRKARDDWVRSFPQDSWNFVVNSFIG